MKKVKSVLKPGQLWELKSTSKCSFVHNLGLLIQKQNWTKTFPWLFVYGNGEFELMEERYFIKYGKLLCDVKTNE